MHASRKNRWSLAFADLSLLLLAFTVLSLVQPMALVEQQGAAKGAEHLDFPAFELFEAGEAMLSPQGIDQARQLAVQARKGGLQVKLSMDAAGKDAARLDRWELSAARMAAFARAMHEAGLDEKDILFGSQARRQNAAEPRLYLSLQPPAEGDDLDDGTSLASYSEN